MKPTPDLVIRKARKIGFEFDVSKARRKVYDILGNIQGITVGQQLDAIEFTISNVEHFDLFMCILEAFHYTYVLRALERNRKILKVV